jgi:hypothetical protein
MASKPFPHPVLPFVSPHWSLVMRASDFFSLSESINFVIYFPNIRATSDFAFFDE